MIWIRLKAIWETIKTRHVGAERVREARLETLMANFDRLKMKEADTIDVFVGKLSEISSNSAALGETIVAEKIYTYYCCSRESP